MNKPPLTYEEQIEKLQQRGLIIENEVFALHCLRHYNYYRLSVYWRVFTEVDNHDRFRSGTRFEDVWQVYDFDRELRKLVNEACKRLEISARSCWAYELAQKWGNQAYENPEVFNHKPNHTKLLCWADARFEESREQFVRHYKEKGCHRPEIWVMVELLDFGQFCRFYNATKQARTRKNIAKSYELDEKSFASLLDHCRYLRNLCAHHSRLWNRRFLKKLSIPNKKPTALVSTLQHFPIEEQEEKDSRKIYNSLVLLIHCMRLIEPKSGWDHRLLNHIKTLPGSLVPYMGFPENWISRPIWEDIMENLI